MVIKCLAVFQPTLTELNNSSNARDTDDNLLMLQCHWLIPFFLFSCLVATQCVIEYQALPCLLNLLSGNYKKSIKKEACWTVSNITAGNREQIQVIMHVHAFSIIVAFFSCSAFFFLGAIIYKLAIWLCLVTSCE